MILLDVCVLETILVLVYSGLILLFYALLRPVDESDLPDGSLPFVSVIVPARNEQGKIERCLESLARQNYPRYEIIAIDDRSTDDTGKLIAELARKNPIIKPVCGKETPDGWIGKCNALLQAVGHATGEWFLFADADTVHEPNSLRDSVSYALRNHADLVSFMPVQELGSFWERLCMPLLLGSFLCGDPLHTVNDPNNSRAYAYGQYILARRSAYLATRGHQAVRNEIVEDHALARSFKQRGYKIAVADGASLYSVRMYTDAHSLFNGWTKNLYSLIECRPLYLVVVLLLINCCVLLPFVLPFFIAFCGASGGLNGKIGQACLLVILQLLATAVAYAKAGDHFQGIDWRHFFLLPLGSLAVSALYLNSAYRVHARRQVDWKGRRYTVNTSKTIEATGLSAGEQSLGHRFMPKTWD